MDALKNCGKSMAGYQANKEKAKSAIS